MVDWNEARDLLEEQVAAVFDVTAFRLVGYRPGLSVNHPAQIDPDREAFSFSGTLDLQPPADRIARYPPGDPATPGGGVAYAAVLTAHMGAWPWQPRRGDRIERCGDGKAFRIEAVERDGSARAAWYLSEVIHARG